MAGWLFHHVPALDSLRTYSLRSLNADLMAGLTVATVAVPQAMAYATLAGLPPHYGLYTAVVMTAVGALLDSSKQLINGPTNAISIALLSALAVLPEEQRATAAVGFALLVGLVQLGITFMRLGDLTRYVSHAVIVGFTLGAGILLVLDQFKNLVGFETRGTAADHFLKRFWLTLSSGRLHAPTVMVGFGTIVLVVAIRRLNGWLRHKGSRFPIPQHLVAVVIMAVLVWALALHERGVKTVGDIGHIPASLPQFRLPHLKWEQVTLLTGNAFGVAILGLLEAIAMAKAIAVQTGQRLDINQQCLSEGMANLAGSFFQCMPGSGSLTRSAVNQQAGAVSQWSGVFSALAVAITLLLFAPYASYIPVASLAGLLMLAAFRMVDFRQLSFHLRATRFDALIVLATALAAIFISVEFCIVIGVFLSFALYVARAAQVQLIEYTLTDSHQVRERLPNDPRCGRMLLCSLEGEISFGAAPEVEAHFAGIAQQAGADIRVVLLFLRRARNPDASFISLLTEFQRRLQARKIDLLLCGVRPDLARALRSTGLEAQIGREHIVPENAQPGVSVSEALRRAYETLNPDLCSICPRRTQKPDDDALHYMI
ncbi:MAG TPA: SulP family inorganic anion transporter [Candidatus Binataceae bacterium]|nr:SulP family inorganic anion transporter [Candidatus Binataceae bacterium]